VPSRQNRHVHLFDHDLLFTREGPACHTTEALLYGYLAGPSAGWVNVITGMFLQESAEGENR
jgi:hypothetical protein